MLSRRREPHLDPGTSRHSERRCGHTQTDKLFCLSRGLDCHSPSPSGTPGEQHLERVRDRRKSPTRTAAAPPHVGDTGPQPRRCFVPSCPLAVSMVRHSAGMHLSVPSELFIAPGKWTPAAARTGGMRLAFRSPDGAVPQEMEGWKRNKIKRSRLRTSLSSIILSAPNRRKAQLNDPSLFSSSRELSIRHRGVDAPFSSTYDE